MTQEQLALASNLSPGFIALVESGVRQPSLGALVALAGTLRRELWELLFVDVKDPRAELVDAIHREDWDDAANLLSRLRKVSK